MKFFSAFNANADANILFEASIPSLHSIPTIQVCTRSSKVIHFGMERTQCCSHEWSFFLLFTGRDALRDRRKLHLQRTTRARSMWV
jgi:hypothetical protein